jgi:hypothetical protein
MNTTLYVIKKRRVVIKKKGQCMKLKSLCKFGAQHKHIITITITTTTIIIIIPWNN